MAEKKFYQYTIEDVANAAGVTKNHCNVDIAMKRLDMSNFQSVIKYILNHKMNKFIENNT